VIGFGLLAFLLVLVYRAYRSLDTVDAQDFVELEFDDA
jgi:multisubunit Na+/H+ antiporter MnhC subunit